MILQIPKAGDKWLHKNNWANSTYTWISAYDVDVWRSGVSCKLYKWFISNSFIKVVR